jgi:hypothetical protein
MTPDLVLQQRPLDSRPARVLSALREPCRYLGLHRWFLALAAIDVVLTTLVLRVGGQEANVVPRAILENAGLGGMILLKTVCVVVVLLACEIVGRRREEMGRRLALLAVAANTLAATMGAAYLTIFCAAALD